MIKLDNIKHIFVDFDDTLVIHDHNSHIYEKNKSIKDAILGNDAYPYSVPNKAVITLLRNAEKEQIEIHVLSWVNTSLETKVKEEYCHRHFPGLVSDVIGTASPEKQNSCWLLQKQKESDRKTSCSSMTVLTH